MKTDAVNSQNPQPKEPYHTPELTEHGTVEEITGIPIKFGFATSGGGLDVV